ncbi:prolyl oligopeptidase family serine peptidase [Kitasatospora sp. NPDC047058]|uniref:alpha/beta hydrolase family protein n=1 Tax=Kitasatospora sp. NPDC047058 TaxID=3155620 RepID=UPI0033F9253F
MTIEGSNGLSPAWVARNVVAFDELRFAHGFLWWLQSDPEHGGVRRIMRSDTAGRGLAVTPPQIPVGGQLHAYGGGSFAVAGDAVWFVGDAGRSVCRHERGRRAVRAVSGGGDDQFGDLALTTEDLLLAVRGGESADEIVSVSPAGETRVLVRSSGFLAAPRLRDGVLAYLEWDRQEMPWDGSRLLLAETRPGNSPQGSWVAGGPTESVVQPSWGPDGALYFMSDRTGWWNLHRFRDGAVETVVQVTGDCAPAPWEGGYQSYDFTSTGGIVLITGDGISSELLLVEGSARRKIASNLTSIKPYLAVAGETVAVIGATPDLAPAVWVADLAADPDAPALPLGGEVSSSPSWTVQEPVVETVESDDVTLRYLLHRSRHDRPGPLLVRAHPGPTDDVPLRLDWTTQYFVSHGFSVAEVLYRGSTGQGRAFRQALHGHWGDYDVEDCAAVAEHLIATGVAAAGAVFISGASAGGYTALQAACQPGPFSAATATSAIIDPAQWEQSVPAFQRPHAAVLAGPAGAVRPERVRIPVLLIHGTEDTITSPEDAMLLADRLAATGDTHQRLLLKGGDHYLSDPTSRALALQAELDFYRRVMSHGPS